MSQKYLFQKNGLYLKWIALSWLILATFGIALGQTSSIKFDHLTVHDGLSINTVYCVYQDSRGFMWFGTKEGLNKYNGYSYTHYRYDPKDDKTLSHNIVRVILEDSQRNLWVGTENGLNVLNKETDTFTRYQHNPADPESISDDIIESIYEDSQNNLWIGTRNNGLNRLDRKSGRFTRFLPVPAGPDAINGNRITSITEDRKGNLYVGTYEGLNRFNRDTGTFTAYAPPAMSASLRILSGYADAENRLWLGTQLGLYSFDPAQQTFVHYPFKSREGTPLPHRTINGICEGTGGTLWLSTSRGVGIFDKHTGTFSFYLHDINDPYSLTDNAIHCAYKDQNGDVWFGTYFGGANVVHKNYNRFTHYFTSASPNTLSGKVIRSLVEDARGNLWIGTEDAGLTYLDRQTGVFSHIRAAPGVAGRLNHHNIQSIVQDSTGNLWVGTYGGGVSYYNIRSQTFTAYLHSREPGSLSNDNVVTLYLDSRGRLWVGTDEGGLNVMDGRTRQFVAYREDPADPESLSNNTVLSISEDQAGNLWVGTTNGLNRFDPEKNRFKRYMFDPQAKSGLSGPSILSIFEDSQQRLWVGTNEGLCRLDRDTDAFTVFSEKDGLPDHTIYSITEDDGKNVWLSTNKGISRFNPTARTFRNYNAADGLQGNQFNYHAVLKSRTGELFFGGINGFNSFFPGQITDSEHVPPIVITDFLLFNKPVSYLSEQSPLKKTIGETTDIVLAHNQNVFGFEFAVLNFQAADNTRYAYKLDGFDTGWNYIGSKRTVSFTNLSPGNYTLWLKGTNSDGVWDNRGTRINIQVLPPLWRTWWAYTLYVLIFGLLLYILRQNTISKVQLKNDLRLERLTREKIEEVNQAKLTFFTNISHEFRTPLTLILGPLENLISTYREDKELRKHLNLMRVNAQRLLKLVNELMDLRKVQSGKMDLHPEKTEIHAFVRELVLPFADFAESHQLTFTVEIPPDPFYLWLDRDKMHTIFYNIFSNAVKYTPDGGNIRITIRSSTRTDGTTLPADAQGPDSVEITVADSGIGIPGDQLQEIFSGYYRIENSGTHKQAGTGIGLALTKELVELHGGTIRVESEEGKGSTFTICLPVNPPAGDTAGEAPSVVHVLAGLKPDFETEPAGEDPKFDLTELKRTEPLVLIVEDDPAVRQFIRDSLKAAYRIIEAADGAAGYELALDKAPEVIISDIMMPVLRGTDLCAKIKGDFRTSHIPVILLTARTLMEHQIEGVEMGADAYITKPFHPDFLRATVKNILDARNRLLQRFSGSTADLKPAQATTPDEVFLKKAVEKVEENMANAAFDIKAFCMEMGISNTLLYNKLKALTGLSANEFIRHIRLKKSAELLLHSKLTVSEVAYEVGFNDPRYFSRCFRKEFGVAPSDYATSESNNSVLT